MAKVKVDGVEYELPKATLGELRTIKREFGVVLTEDTDLRDPDVAAALAYIAMRRALPATTVADIDRITSIDFLDDEDAEDVAEETPTRPTKAVRAKGKAST